MKKRKELVIEDPVLHHISYCINHGLRKLVPSTCGWCTFSKYGEHFHEEDIEPEPWEIYYQTGETPEYNEYLVVQLCIYPTYPEKNWNCVITIMDGDDLCFQRWMEFNLENWKKQVEMYNSINFLDHEIMQYLRLEGFS